MWGIMPPSWLCRSGWSINGESKTVSNLFDPSVAAACGVRLRRPADMPYPDKVITRTREATQKTGGGLPTTPVRPLGG